MWQEQYRVLKTGGLLYVSMASNIGIDIEYDPLDDWKWQFKDGTVRFLLTQNIMNQLNISDQFEWLEPLKAVNLNGEHSYAVMVLQKK